MLPLTGCRLLNTRPTHQARALTKAVQALGGSTISCPALAITPCDPAWLHTLPPLETIDQVIVISANAAQHFFAVYSPDDWPTHLTLIAIGYATAHQLEALGLTVHHTPTIARTEALLQLSCLVEPRNKRILIIQGKGGRDLLVHTLRLKHAHVTQVAVYERTMPTIEPASIEQIWRNDLINIILLTSEQAMTQLFALFGEAAQNWLRSKPCVVISDRLEQAASKLGIKTIFKTQPDALLQGLIAAHHLASDSWKRILS